MASPNPATRLDIREELSRVLMSRQFADSPRLSKFLTYIVEKTLAEETGQIKEYSIGPAVFGRPPDFDPRLDTIVRVQASKLRGRLSEYYAGEGAANTVKIRLPRGSYVPTFDSGGGVEPAGLEEISRAEPPLRRWWHWRAATVVVAVTLAFGLGFISALRFGAEPSRQEAIRFLIPAPSDGVFKGPSQVSPDGKKIVSGIFRKAEGDTAIYLHNIESGTGGILPGTAGGGFAYWSQDGKSILFATADQLKRFDLASAEPVVVARGAHTGFGADSNRNGVIILGTYPGPVRRLSASGGELEPVTVLDKSHRGHVFPRFLPDGNHFVYLARSETPNDSAIYVASLDGKLNKRILQNETKAQFVPSMPSERSVKGYLLFVRAGSLMVQRFDPDRFELGGEARQVVAEIPVYPYGTSPFSASANGVLAYSSSSGPGPVGQLTWFDRAGRIAGTLGPIGDPGDPVISPDGKRVAFDLTSGSNRDIWTLEISSGKTSRITFDPEVDHCPVWSPDGSRIAFESHRNPRGLYIAASGGGGAESLVVRGADYISDWGTDGHFLLFGSMRPLFQHPDEICLLRFPGADSPRRWLHSEAKLFSPVLSPDCRWIAYVSDEAGPGNIYVQRFNGGLSPGAGRWQISVGGGSQPTWRADGKELFYLSSDNHLMAVTVRAGPVFVYDSPVPLFDTRLRILRGPRNDYATRDGNQFLIQAPSQATPAPPLHVIVNWSAALGN